MDYVHLESVFGCAVIPRKIQTTTIEVTSQRKWYYNQCGMSNQILVIRINHRRVSCYNLRTFLTQSSFLACAQLSLLGGQTLFEHNL